MVDRWWLAAGVLVAALAGCGGPETKDDSTPPPENPAGPEMTGTPGEGLPSDQQADQLALTAAWTPERKAAVKAGDDEVGMLEPGQDAGEQVIGYLKGKLDAMKAAGKEPKVTIVVAVDMKFDEIGKPLMKACFKAGFRASQVEYKPTK